MVTVLSVKEDSQKGQLGYVVNKKGRSDDFAVQVIKDLEDFWN